MDECTLTNGWEDEWIHECVSEWIPGLMHAWMGG